MLNPLTPVPFRSPLLLLLRNFSPFYQKRWGKETAKNLTNYIENKVREEMEQATKILATKDQVADVKTSIAEVKADIIKWMFLFWIGQIVATIAIILLKK